ncbi:DUF4126 domain-containing protein [Methylobacterium brachythecii]|uniref:DUF4126 domain-containing protein n=1 Tax=Methylobacterium brachythecii TaxID=1176177 RepID=A0A7W6AED9_9HYPH|nr:DUF4126 domain-containing protein [Methylobacterium brachythecii]MBB3901737.1 hypothetical protein [Methylobacterium brachythecii]GLS43906.1 hypothetical protein GCM10007884_18920 [Methylobacterium brachythecii]
MGAPELIGLGASIGLLSGWRIYLCTFALGLAMHYGWVQLPQHLHALDALASPTIIGISAVGLIAEFFADKIPWLDSLWDGIHTFIRPIGGALLAAAVIDPQDPTWQIASLLLGGSAALLTHGAKASARAVANASPEPFSNIGLSLGEDVTTTGLLLAVLIHPAAAATVAGLIALAAVAAIVVLWRLLRRIYAKRDREPAQPAMR